METDRIVASFEVPYTRYLDPAGKLIRPLPADTKDPATLLALYRALVRTRSFDAKAG